MPTREAVIGKLAKERDALVAWARSLGERASTAATESEDPAGRPWTSIDHLVHLAGIERAFCAMVERTLAGDASPVRLGAPSATREQIMAGVHANNQKVIDAPDAPGDVEAAIADLGVARAATIGLVERLSDEELARKVPGAPWGDGTIGGVLMTCGYHEAQHRTWVDEGLAAKS